MFTLDNIKVNEKVRVKKINCPINLKSRIMDMGITCGTEICIEKCAPLGDPIQLNVRGYNLSIRKADAKNIEVIKLGL